MEHKDQIPLEEQLARRQSAPRPTAEGYVQQKRQLPSGTLDGFRALAQVIGREQVQKARLTMQKYKEGKHHLEQKVIQNEQWYKLRNWECMRKSDEAPEQVEPTSAWLFNAVANKHADAMDNFPSANILPREEGDVADAEMLTAIVPVVLQQNEFEETYSVESDDKIKSGTGIYGVFWDASKLNGLGDISVEQVDVLELFWEPGVTDIQKSRNLFHVKLRDNEDLEAEYPQLRGSLGSAALDISQYIYDDRVDTTTKSAVVDWYYKKRAGGRTVLHYCKFCNDTVLFATENEPEKYPKGWYDHGMYPYVFDPLFRMKGTPCGFGLIDVAKSPQEFIDRGDQGIQENMLANASPRSFVNGNAQINEKEYADLRCKLVHVDGNLGQDAVRPIEGKPLDTVYVQVQQNKIEELKEVTGNRDVSTGGTASGVTAAAAIAAMQEAGSKLSRDNNKASYRAFRKVVRMIIELIRQFYDLPRCFRIVGEDGSQRFVEYSNAGLRPQHQGFFAGQDLGYRTPLFDIEITAQKASPYSRLSQNELALQFFGHGFFNPELADQALACLEMMDFDRKQFVMKRISQNGGMYQQLMIMQQQIMQLMQMQGLAPAPGAGDQQAPPPQQPEAGQTEALGGAEGPKEHHSTRNARQRVAESTAPV